MPKTFLRGATALCTSLCLVGAALHPAPAEARGGFGAALGLGIAAGIIGAAAGSAIASQPQYRVRVVQPRYYVVRRPRTNPGEAVITLQRALAALGFYTGDITGKMDKPTLLAVGQFQQKIGDKPTGRLTTLQRQVLFANYAQSVKPSGNPSAGPSSPSQPAQPAQPAGAVLLAAIAAANGPTQPGQSSNVGPADVTPSSVIPPENPRFFRTACREDFNNESVQPAKPILTAGALRLTPDQFCVGRTAALAEASDTLAKSGQTDIAAVRNGCRSFTDGMKPQLSTLLTTPAATFAQKLQKDFGSAKGDAAENNYRICLGIGYAEDQPEMVLASALGLVGVGQAGYAELIAGVMGVGVAPYDNRTRSAEWLDFSAAQIEKGAPTPVKDLGADRAGVLKLAAKEMRSDPGSRPAVALLTTPALPTVEKATPAIVVPVATPVAVVTAPVVTTPADPREAMSQQARAFFTKEGAEQTSKLEALSSVLGLGKADIAERCKAFTAANAAPDAAKGLDPSMALRLCRAWSYSVGDGSAMYLLDRKLADAGDTDAASRLPLHMIAGNDKAVPKAN